MRNDLIIGLDIGSSHVRAIAGKQNDRGRLEILATGSSVNTNNVLNGEIVNINKTTAAISEAMNQISHVLDGKIQSTSSPLTYLARTLKCNRLAFLNYARTREIPFQTTR